MRDFINNQYSFEQEKIENLRLDMKCRDDIPKLLLGLKHIFLNVPVRDKVLEIIRKVFNEKNSLKLGRPGMDLWRIFVLATVRTVAAVDYDRLHDLANKHQDIRTMLLTSMFHGEKWTYETIQENVRLLTPEMLNEINTIVVNLGHTLKKKYAEDPSLYCRADSFVCKTNVEYPTDIRMISDACRKVVKLVQKSGYNEGFRQGHHLCKEMSKISRVISFQRKQKRKLSEKQKKNKKNKPEILITVQKNEEAFIQSHKDLIHIAEVLIKRANMCLNFIKDEKFISEIKYFISHVELQINQITRRVINEEKIPQEEKVYSIFEPHTEWISKGKAGVPSELGIKIAIIEDQYGFILNHRVMQNEQDADIAVQFINDTKKIFPNLKSNSYDKGFYSLVNKKSLDEALESLCMPKKGKKTKKQAESEREPKFKKMRNQHSAVESAINCLNNHGLEKCMDKGIDGFKRNAALAIVGRNIFQIGRILHEKGLKKLQREARAKKKILFEVFAIAA